MNNLSAGSAELFAIEFQPVHVQPAPFGRVQLWIGGLSIGYADEPTFLYPVLLSLEGVLQRDRAPEELVWLERDAAWSAVQTQDQRYLLSSVDLLDEIVMYAIASEQHVRFIWRMLDGDALHDTRLPRGVMQKTVDQLRAYFDGLVA